ncbi:hypothetical protein NDU88_001697 [Pleurodeles waltl]|uniref:Uncharacterized protein n=1 Tax=Pleurodeles waltl TaxID=8319 RepID=A0AAV7RBZ8_PLEWA|nr:hypothetical protein NDU88_001695 [Pleurodeles waltl]KAJ1148873.1 hypothetical protein NDU88_001697 [Pleurodeles waltl]
MAPARSGNPALRFARSPCRHWAFEVVLGHAASQKHQGIQLSMCSPMRGPFICPPTPGTPAGKLQLSGGDDAGNEGLDYSVANREKPYFILGRYA